MSWVDLNITTQQEKPITGRSNWSQTLQSPPEGITHANETTPEDSALLDYGGVHEDIGSMVNELHDTVQVEPRDSFRRVFWEQQVST